MKKLIGVSILYLYLPFLVFLFGWINPFLAVPVALLSCYAIYHSLQGLSTTEVTVQYNWIELIIVFLLALSGCIVCGHGGFFIQDFDWSKHNAILHDLTVFPWPVQYDGDILLTYYIGNYLIPALIGKMFASTQVSRLFLPIWNAIGILLIYCLCGEYLNANTLFRKTLLLFFIFFWSGAVNLGSRLYHLFGHNNYVESWKWLDYQNVKVHFASNFDSLRGGFQHVIIPWVSCSVFIHERERCDFFLLVALPLLFGSTFGFLWFAVLLLFYCLFLIATKRVPLKNVFSLTNILLLPLAAVVLVYLFGNVFSEKPKEVGFSFLNMFKHFDFYVCFTLSEFLLYALFLYQSHRRDALYVLVILELLLIPFFSLGLYNDLCSRGSIPARFLLMIWCLEEIYKGENKVFSWGIALVFAFGLINEFRELEYVYAKSSELEYQQSECTMDEYGSLNGFAGNMNMGSDNAYNYYTMQYSDSLFKMIAR